MLGYDNNAERVSRRLREEPMSPKWHCIFGWHIWERWEHSSVQRFTDSKKRFVESTRYCRFCGLPQMRHTNEKMKF